MKLRHISIENYKGIDHLELDFPAPELPGDPDVVVIGSENGLGKTSVLECCALTFWANMQFSTPATCEIKFFCAKHFDLLVRSGTSHAKIAGEISDGTRISSELLEKEILLRREPLRAASGFFEVAKNSENKVWDDFQRVCGFDLNPIITNDFLFFHSYRKILEDNPRLGTLLLAGKQSPHDTESESLVSVFKRTVLFSIMSNADLFDTPQEHNAQQTLDILNELLHRYADCQFAKMRPALNDTIELRVQPINGEESFSFDGLSSGQKEIITTLFLIWYETRNQPKVVLIDEPELHLNSQWHRSFINSLVELAPKNQYIIATHSATVMDSVDRSRRILLQRELC